MVGGAVPLPCGRPWRARCRRGRCGRAWRPAARRAVPWCWWPWGAGTGGGGILEVVFFFFFFWSGSPAWGSLGGVGAVGTHRWVHRAVPNVGPGGGGLLRVSWGAGWGAGGAQSIRRGSSSCSAPGRGTRPLALLGATMGSGSGPCPPPAPPRGRLPRTLQKEQPGCDPPGGLHGCWAAPELLAEEGTFGFAWIRGPSSCAFAPGAGGCRMTTPEQIWGGGRCPIH